MPLLKSFLFLKDGFLLCFSLCNYLDKSCKLYDILVMTKKPNSQSLHDFFILMWLTSFYNLPKKIKYNFKKFKKYHP